MDDELRALVRDYLVQLAYAMAPPGDVADWALRMMAEKSAQSVDPVIWRTLNRLARADLLVSNQRFQYGPDDFFRWLEEFENECP